ncbi:MAG: imidazole glycerol phosphate synthase subunit HisH [Spirochaetaceae bacterium]|jgi:imidazole glycerol phosphate synthase glutamine amidotransferase subunit|nr:imidazole glycerol phosphate synthase subunit HisH [Spirochaetaceae bacterium]
MIGVVNYGAGNLGSVMNALNRLGLSARFTQGPEELIPRSTPFEKIIFPGDGHFASAMESLERSGYAQALKEWIAADKPFLGICIGLQLLFDTSEEAPPVQGTPRLGLQVIPGTVRRFPGRKVPQIGWNRTSFATSRSSSLFHGLREQTFFYYIHSYYADPCIPDYTVARAVYMIEYCAAIERGAVAAVQFHPEKSGAWGLKLLENWAIQGP